MSNKNQEFHITTGNIFEDLGLENLVSGKLSAFSTEILMHYPSLLGCNIETSLLEG